MQYGALCFDAVFESVGLTIVLLRRNVSVIRSLALFFSGDKHLWIWSCITRCSLLDWNKWSSWTKFLVALFYQLKITLMFESKFEIRPNYLSMFLNQIWKKHLI
ncbi:hypothetical protein ACOSQ2_002054 [Xanthoceras sorbifolium]